MYHKSQHRKIRGVHSCTCNFNCRVYKYIVVLMLSQTLLFCALMASTKFSDIPNFCALILVLTRMKKGQELNERSYNCSSQVFQLLLRTLQCCHTICFSDLCQRISTQVTPNQKILISKQHRRKRASDSLLKFWHGQDELCNLYLVTTQCLLQKQLC